MGATYERAIHPKPRGMKAELVRFVLKSRAEMPEAQMSTSDMQINASSQKDCSWWVGDGFSARFKRLQLFEKHIVLTNKRSLIQTGVVGGA